MEHTFALISLGCPKNLVNSEQMLYLMTEAGFQLVPDPEGADLAIINTCGFIDSAKSEAIDTILETAEYKKNGTLGGIIVTGCLAERYQDSIQKELPEIDAVLGVGSFGDIVEAAKAVLERNGFRSFADNSAAVDEIPRVVSQGRPGRTCVSPRAATISAPSARFPLSAGDTALVRWKTSSRKQGISRHTV